MWEWSWVVSPACLVVCREPDCSEQEHRDHQTSQPTLLAPAQHVHNVVQHFQSHRSFKTTFSSCFCKDIARIHPFLSNHPGAIYHIMQNRPIGKTAIARQGIEFVLPPKQQRRPLPFLLSLSFFWQCVSTCQPDGSPCPTAGPTMAAPGWLSPG